VSAANLPGIILAIVVLAFGAVGLAFRIPQSSRALRLQSLRRAETIVYLTRRTPAWMNVARAFEVHQVGRLKWEFFIRITSDGWTLSNSDLIARAFIPWSAIGPIQVADDAPANRAFRKVLLRVTFEVRGEPSDLEVYLYGWLWSWYPLPNDPSANPIDVASMNTVVRELEGLRPAA